MAAIQLSGLASGLDWQSLISQLIAVERTPETQMNQQKSTDATKISGLSTIKQDLLDLQTSSDALTTGNAFTLRSASVADSSSGWSASADAGAAAGSYIFNVSQLASKAAITGAGNVSSGISATNDVSGVTLATMNIAAPITAGSFTVNGAQISIAITDSLQDVFDKISTATSGAVTASYDPASDKVSLASASPILLGAANDTSNFLSALQLYNNGTGNIFPPTSLGVVSVASAIKSADLKTSVTNVDAGGNGSFSINGVNISFNANNDSVLSVLGRINSSGAGVTASYDTSTNRFSITNNTTGDTGIAISESSGGLLEALGLNSTGTFNRGTNAQFSMNNGPTLTSASNTFGNIAGTVSGLTVTATSTGSQTINVASDTSGTLSQINNFIAKYNALQSYLASQTKTTLNANGTVTTSTFSGNSEVSNIASSLRSIAFGAVSGLNGAIKRLADIGIDFQSGTSQLQIVDATKLQSAIQNNTSDVQALFTGTGGLASHIDSYVMQTTGTSGTLAVQTDSLNKNSTDIDSQIAALERRITADQARMTSEFVAMEQAQSLLQQQSTALNNAFGVSSGSSTSNTSTARTNG